MKPKQMERSVSFRVFEDKWNELDQQARKSGINISEYCRRKIYEDESDGLREVILRIDSRILTARAILNVMLEAAGFDPEDEEQMTRLEKIIKEEKLRIIEAENEAAGV